MPLESANNFEQLDETWPLLGDTMKQTGGHIRQLKKVIKTIFPGINGNGFNIPIESIESEWNQCIGLENPVQAQLTSIKSNAVLVSAFIPYSGSIASIPANYQLCNGTNGTPDLTDTFIMGTTIQGEIGQTGGSPNKIVPLHSHNMDHTHSVTLTTDGDHIHNIDTSDFSDPSNPPGVIGGSSLATLVDTPQTTTDGEHAHTITVNNELYSTSTDGAAATDTNNPAWVKLAFIMRIT